MDDRSDLTRGDPLGGDEPSRGSLFDDPVGGDAAGSAYGDRPVPPGAFVPRRERPPLPSADQLAGFGPRALAFVVDGLVVAGLALAVVVVIGTTAGWGVEEDPLAAVGWAVLFIVLSAALALVYAPAIMSRTDGQTIGKRLAGIRVVRTDGRPIGFGWAVYREVLIKGLLVGVAAVLTGGIAYLVNFLWPTFDRQNRALHDYVVDSRVVRA